MLTSAISQRVQRTRSVLQMDELKLAGWQRIYQEALAESDQVKLLTKICAAEGVLYAYLQQHDEPTQRNEVIAVFDAIHSLRILRSRLYSQTKRDELALIWKQGA